MKRVLIAMSGGVDSSMAALLLKKEGYDVVGVTMKTWDYSSTNHNGKEMGCCNLESFNDARMIAVDNSFPHYVLDLREEFTTSVVDNFVDQYLVGLTPNPCIRCNTHIKWKVLFKKAEQLDCDYIATGHYAKIAMHGERRFIQKAKDEYKDQSYVLWGLSQEVLKKTLFPVSAFTKPEIRAMMAEWGYNSLSKKKDSYEICFIPDNNYHDFLKKKVNNFTQKIREGDFVDKQGDIIGRHRGYPFYTVGQRKGLGIAFGKPMYVLDINAVTNNIILGEEEDLVQHKAEVHGVNWQKIVALQGNEELEVTAKIRYRDSGTKALISRLSSDSDYALNVKFTFPVKGLAPGQSAVFYDEDDLLCGGVISKN